MSKFFFVSVILESSFRELKMKKGLWFGSFVFGIAVCLIFSIATGTEAFKNSEISSGIFWTIAEFAIAITYNHLFMPEIESKMLDAIIGSGVPKYAFYIGKFLYSSILTFSLVFALNLVWGLFFQPINYFHQLRLQIFLCPAFSLATASIGTTVAALTCKHEAKELMFSILFFPFQIMILICCALLTTNAIDPERFTDFNGSALWTMLIVFPFIFLSITLLLSENLFQE